MISSPIRFVPLRTAFNPESRNTKNAVGQRIPVTDIQPIKPFTAKPGRHRWGEPARFPYKTERTCIAHGCGITKVTRHEPDVHPWLEFFRDGQRIVCERTPSCTGLAVATGPTLAVEEPFR